MCLNRSIHVCVWVGCLAMLPVSGSVAQSQVSRDFLRNAGETFTVSADAGGARSEVVPAHHTGGDTLLVLRRDNDYVQVRYLTTAGATAEGWLSKDAIADEWQVSELMQLGENPARPAPGYQDAIREHTEWGQSTRLLVSGGLAQIGMSLNAVTAAFGEPKSSNKFRTAVSQFEQRTYRTRNQGQLILSFENGLLQQHHYMPPGGNTARATPQGIVPILALEFPHRRTGIHLVVGGSILLLGSIFTWQSHGDLTSSSSRSLNKKFGLGLLSLGVLSEGLGIYLIKYSQPVDMGVGTSDGQAAAIGYQWRF